MRRILTVFCLATFTVALSAQAPAGTAAKPKLAAPQVPPKAQSAAPQVVKDLPVRKVVLYKNGVATLSTPARLSATSAWPSISPRRS